jgi:transcriptional regulator with XRE-family HTH domain
MDKISAFTQRNPIALAKGIGDRLRALRIAKGWTQEELAERSGVAISTLKLLEARGQGSLQRLIRIAVALGVDGELRELFSRSFVAESIEAVKLAERRRAPRRRGKGAVDGA